MTDRQLKRNSRIDVYGRHALIRDIIDANRPVKGAFRILDVGGRYNQMRNFLPDDEVYYLDPNTPEKAVGDENYIVGDGCDIPLENDSFDWVTSADVFEHIEPAKRERFLRENIRVAKQGVVLVAPFRSSEVERAEINVNEYHKKLTGGKDHMWLKEHIESGLPAEDEMEQFLASSGCSYQKMHNNNLVLWELTWGPQMLLDVRPMENIEQEYGDFLEFYNTHVYPVDGGQPSYRKVYFIKKNPELKNLEQKEQKIPDELFLDIIQKSNSLLYAALNEKI